MFDLVNSKITTLAEACAKAKHLESKKPKEVA